jgi:ubiquinone/menaquinone biosynthesis C-methylase UbiE
MAYSSFLSFGPLNNFNLIAPYYDSLAQTFFGGAILESQCFYLDEINESQRVLILGGGTGALLDHLTQTCQIDFLDKSSKMIKLVRQKHCRVNPIHCDFLHWSTDMTFDVIICPFFLDCLNTKNLQRVMDKIRSILKPEGILIVTDFRLPPFSLLSIIMHLFFKLVTGLESSFMKDLDAALKSYGFVQEREQLFCNSRIFSSIYRNL